jgi:tripartite-type tricarboxylate transporter receptor subunit TctC
VRRARAASTPDRYASSAGSSPSIESHAKIRRIRRVRSGGLRALAVTAATRTDALPGVPTVGEFIPGYEAIAVAGIGAPNGTDTNVIEKLNSEINSALADPAVKARLVGLGVAAVGGPPADFAKLIARETDRWSKVIRTAGIKPN